MEYHDQLSRGYKGKGKRNPSFFGVNKVVEVPPIGIKGGQIWEEFIHNPDPVLPLSQRPQMPVAFQSGVKPILENVEDIDIVGLAWVRWGKGARESTRCEDIQLSRSTIF